MKLPKPLQILWDGWMTFSRILGRIVSTILLTIFWIVGIGLYAIIMNIIVLARAKKQPTTHWIDVPPQKKEHLLQQF